MSNTTPHHKQLAAPQQRALEIVQSDLRTRILLYLLSTNISDLTKIRENVNATKASVWNNVGVLEDEGLIECDTPKGERHGKAPRFWIAPPKVVELLTDYLDLYPESIRLAVAEKINQTHPAG